MRCWNCIWEYSVFQNTESEMRNEEMDRKVSHMWWYEGLKGPWKRIITVKSGRQKNVGFKRGCGKKMVY